MAEVMAVIKRPQFGVNDRGGVSLSFTTYVSDAGAADQYLNPDDAVKVLKDAGVSDVSKLEGRTCWVDSTGQIIRFLRMTSL